MTQFALPENVTVHVGGNGYYWIIGDIDDPDYISDFYFTEQDVAEAAWRQAEKIRRETEGDTE
jgi:hypothetical protein